MCFCNLKIVRETNNTKIGGPKNWYSIDWYNIDIVMPMYNLKEYSGTYPKTSGSYSNTIEMDQL